MGEALVKGFWDVVFSVEVEGQGAVCAEIVDPPGEILVKTCSSCVLPKPFIANCVQGTDNVVGEDVNSVAGMSLVVSGGGRGPCLCWDQKSEEDVLDR